VKKMDVLQMFLLAGLLAVVIMLLVAILTLE
jgi:hypothetical protein